MLPMPSRRTVGLSRPTLLLAGLALAGVSTGPASAYSTYYANLHSHCILSDGIGTAAEAFTYARDVANIDVLALTDHTHLLSAAEFSSLLTQATASTTDGVFVALGAQEFGNLNDFNHINIYDAATRNPNPTENLTACYNFIVTSGAFGSFCHPNPNYGSNFDNLTFYPQYADAMRAIEVVNGLASNDYEPQFLQALANGWKVGPAANQDNHQGEWGDKENTNLGGRIYLTGILADQLTKADILEALRARRFFAMEVDPPSDRMEVTFEVDGHPMGSVATTGTGPVFTATARAINGTGLFNRVELFRDGVIIDTKVLIGNQISYQYQDNLSDGESHYYFAKFRQVDGDRAWSAPVWVTAELAPTSVETSPSRLGPGNVALLPSSPNPFHPKTDLRFVLPARSEPGPYRVRVAIHDASGREVCDLGERLLSAGEHRWTWDGRDDQRRPAPAGVYLYTVSGRGLTPSTSRVVLLR